LRRKTVLALFLILEVVIGGETFYVSTLRTQLESSQAEISRLKKILDYYGSGQKIKIGVVVPSPANLESWKTTLNLAEEDINSYLEDLGYHFTFEFIIDDAQGEPSLHLEKIQSFKSMGVDLIIGGGWSSQAGASLSYMNQNHMLLVSPSSTSLSPMLRQVDNFFRLCPNDLVQAPALAEMWKSWGIKAVIIFYSIDPWGEGLLQLMNTELPKRDIEILETVGYAPETTDFSGYLAQMDNIAKTAIEKYGDKKYVGVQIFSFDEQVTFLTQTEQYPNIKDLIWFSTENEGRSQTYIDQVGEPLVSKRLFSPLPRVDEASPKWINLNTRYRALTGQTASFYIGALYDSAWLVALSVFETKSMEARDIVPVIRDVASQTYGVTGWLSLDEYGDREPQIFDVWGYYKDPDDGMIKFGKFGEYNGQAINVIWDYVALVNVGATPPR
jgi:branched-chain amino acid transport system substrate-binding protein